MKKLEINSGLHQYEGHLKRLIKLRYQSNKNQQNSMSNRQLQNSHEGIGLRKQKKMKSDPTLGQSKRTISVISGKIVHRIPPLVSTPEKQLLCKSLETKNMPNRQAELVLENYLLSRRILATKPSIKSKDFKKSFKNHQKYSDMLSKRKQQSINLSQSRIDKFKQYESIDKKNSQNVIGMGKFIFSIHIKQLQTIIRHNQEGKLYNLIIRINPKRYRYSHLTLEDLRSLHSFHFRKKHTTNNLCIEIQIEMISKNQVIKYAQFTINTSIPFAQIQDLSKGESFSFQKNDEINGLKSIKNGKLMGTVLYDYNIKRNLVYE